MTYAKAIKLARQEGNLSYWGLWQNYGYDINKKKTRTAKRIQQAHSREKSVSAPVGQCEYWYS